MHAKTVSNYWITTRNDWLSVLRLKVVQNALALWCTRQKIIRPHNYREVTSTLVSSAGSKWAAAVQRSLSTRVATININPLWYRIRQSPITALTPCIMNITGWILLHLAGVYQLLTPEAWVAPHSCFVPGLVWKIMIVLPCNICHCNICPCHAIL